MSVDLVAWSHAVLTAIQTKTLLIDLSRDETSKPHADQLRADLKMVEKLVEGLMKEAPKMIDGETP